MSSHATEDGGGDPLMYASRLRGLFDGLLALMAYWDGGLRMLSSMSPTSSGTG